MSYLEYYFEFKNNYSKTEFVLSFNTIYKKVYTQFKAFLWAFGLQYKDRQHYKLYTEVKHEETVHFVNNLIFLYK